MSGISPKGKYVVASNAIWEVATGLKKFRLVDTCRSFEGAPHITTFSLDDHYMFSTLFVKESTLPTETLEQKEKQTKQFGIS